LRKTILIVIAVALAFFFLGGYVFQEYINNDEEEKEEEKNKTNEMVEGLNGDDVYFHTLNDFIVSASKGSYIIKMTVTLKFDDEETFAKFRKLPRGEGEDIDPEEAPISLMEIAINDKIGSLIFDADESDLLDKDKLSKYLLQGVNDEFSDNGKDLLENLYIENLVIQ